jgi:selenium metabolism protein YedF
MIMHYTVDARGLACPQPVINTRKALETHERVVAIVDNETALENIRRMARGLGCAISEEKKNDGIYVHLEKTGADPMSSQKDHSEKAYSCSTNGPRVLVLSQDVMGKGDDALGRILMKSFFHTLAETRPVPDTIIFFNSGVKLLVDGSEVIDDIKLLEQNGVAILACGTCLDYFKLKDRLIAGSISNMYDIKELMLSASSTINL